jgi:hypothetical protein
MPQPLNTAAAAAVRTEILRREQAASPEDEISVCVGVTPNADGSLKVVITRSRKSD